MTDRMTEARTMVRRLLDRFVDDGDEGIKEEMREDLMGTDEFAIEDEWGDYETDYDALDTAVDETEEQAIKIVKTMLKEMRNW